MSVAVTGAVLLKKVFLKKFKNTFFEIFRNTYFEENL